MEEKKSGNQESRKEETQILDRSCQDIIEKLNQEKERLENELRHEYRAARKYVRSHPEEGLAYSFVGGMIFGVLLAKIFSR